MKRDPRLARRGERRNTSGGKYGRRPRYRATATRADAIARIARSLHLPPSVLTGTPYYSGYAEQERLYVNHVLVPTAQRVSATLTAELRSHLAFRGEAYILVGWDPAREAATYERLDPSSIAASGEITSPLGQAEYDALTASLGEDEIDVLP